MAIDAGNAALNDLADAIVTEVKSRLAGAVSSLTSSDIALLEGCALDAAGLTLRSMAGEDVVNEMRQVTAQLKNFAAVSMSKAAAVFWSTVSAIASRAAAAALLAI